MSKPTAVRAIAGVCAIPVLLPMVFRIRLGRFGFAALASGMELTRFTVLLGALSVGIGFGLQNVVNNFVSGLILLYERPVQVGDVVEQVIRPTGLVDPEIVLKPTQG